MNEKKYFKYINPHITVVYAFPAKIKVLIASISEVVIVDFSADAIEGESDFEEITETEFLTTFHEVQNEITLRYHNQFSKENDFIKNEALKSEGY